MSEKEQDAATAPSTGLISDTSSSSINEPSSNPQAIAPEVHTSSDPFASHEDSETLTSGDIHSTEQDPEAPSLPPRSTEGTNPMATTAPVTTTGAADPTHAADVEPEEQQDSPQVAALKAMFPDFDSAVLQSVLDTVEGNEDQAIDLLLGMSDPDYVSPTQPDTEPAHPTDTSMDEQLARQLALEDEDERHRGRRTYATGESWAPQRNSTSRQAEQASVPYETRQRNTNPHPQQSGYVTGSERGDFQDFQETVNRIAESGKRTFASIVSKVKAKINEFDQGSTSNPASNPIYPPTSSFQHAPNVTNQPQASSQVPMDRHARTEVYGAGGEWTSVSRRGTATAAASAPVQAQTQEVSGYDVGEPIATPERRSSLAQPSFEPVEIPSTPPALPRGNSMESAVPKPPTTSVGSPINAAKLGLLPKRPVSLLNSQPPSEQTVHPPDEDEDDELEYLENPFEEDGKRK